MKSKKWTMVLLIASAIAGAIYFGIAKRQAVLSILEKLPFLRSKAAVTTSPDMEVLPGTTETIPVQPLAVQQSIQQKVNQSTFRSISNVQQTLRTIEEINRINKVNQQLQKPAKSSK